MISQSRLVCVLFLISLFAAHEVAAQCSRGSGGGRRGGGPPSSGAAPAATASIGDGFGTQFSTATATPELLQAQQAQFQRQSLALQQQRLVQQQMLQQVQMQRRESTLAIRRRNAERTREERAARIASRTMSRRTENLVRGLDQSGFTPQTQFASLIPTAVGVMPE
jgi:hypothetical protein